MKTISVINLKGGVGKTFTAYNLAYELNKRGNKVLVLDNDKQGNISKAYGAYSAAGICQTARLLNGDWQQATDVIQHTQYNGIDIIPANMSLLAATYQITSDQNTEQHTRYKQLLEAKILDHGYAVFDYIPVEQAYDYLIIDNPPDIALNVVNALAITDEVIVPVKIDEWALEGLDIIAEQIETAKALNPNIKLLGAMVTMYKNNDTNIAGLEWLEKKSPVKLLTKIRYTEKAAEATFFAKPIYEYSPRSSAAQDYKNFVTEYLNQQKER